MQPDPSRSPDRLSARWLLAVAARLVRDVGVLITGAAAARRRVATFALDGEVRFASAADRAAFAEELAGAVAALVGKYHDETAEGGRDHRVIVAVHPTVHRAPDIGPANVPSVDTDGSPDPDITTEGKES
ncbi:hypothetical protein GCM10009658_31900 [Planotetraspora silvatica]